MLCMSGLCLDIEPLTHDRPVCAKKSSVNVTKGLKKDITALSGSLRWSCAPCLCFFNRHSCRFRNHVRQFSNYDGTIAKITFEVVATGLEDKNVNVSTFHCHDISIIWLEWGMGGGGGNHGQDNYV